MGATKASPVKLPTQQTPWRPGGGLPGSTAQLGLGPGGCKHRGGGHTSKEPSALGFPAQRPRRSGRPPPVRGREPVTPLVPRHDSLVAGLLSESPRGKQTLAGGQATSTPNTRRRQPRPPPALSSDQAAPELGPAPRRLPDTRTHLVWVVQQQHLRDHSWRHQRAEGRELRAGRRLQLHSHGLSGPTQTSHSWSSPGPMGEGRWPQAPDRHPTDDRIRKASFPHRRRGSGKSEGKSGTESQPSH